MANLDTAESEKGIKFDEKFLGYVEEYGRQAG